MADEQPAQQQAAPQHAGGDDVEKNKVYGIVAYIGILFIVPLLAAKESRFAMYHANQGLNLFIAWVVAGVIGIVPVIGWIIAPLASIVLFIFAIMGLVNAAKGEMKPLPLIGGWQLIK